MRGRRLALIALWAGAAHAGPAREGEVVRVEHRDPVTLPAKGPSNALVTFEVFFSLQYGFKRGQVFQNLERLQAAHPARVRIVYRVLKGALARFPYAALYAYTEGKFFEFIDLLNAQRSMLDDKGLLDLATKVGLDPEQLANVVAKPPAAYDEVLDANSRRQRRRIGPNPGMPAALVNGHPTPVSLSSMSYETLENTYQAELARAYDLMDHGVPRSQLAKAFDQIVQLHPSMDVQSGATDEEIDDPSPAPGLADPPLDYSGLPSHGAPHAEITIAVLCSPRSTNCYPPLNTAERVADIYRDQVRVVWAPYFDVGRDDASDLSLRADAVLCAERDGGRAIDRDDIWDPQDSPGWRWVKEALVQAGMRQPLTADEGIDRIATKLGVEPRAFATCRAQLAGASLTWIEAARRAGVRTTPATIVNGRIYGPINDTATLQELVEQELAPGLLAPAWSQPDLVDP